MTLGERIRARRKRLGLSQGKLARRADIDQGQLSRIESGETTNPGIQPLTAIARALDCSLDYLVDRYDEDHVDPSCAMAAST